ncbi:MAG: GntR family transcriptional regulator [Geminicoccales bacterium]
MKDLNIAVQKPPAHEVVYHQMREMILFGELAPGQAVTIQGLVSRLGSGTTPVREAIRHLTAEGALKFKGNRRICVPELTPAQLKELSFARLAIEPELARLAVSHMSAEDIQKLEKTDDQLDDAIAKGDIGAYLKQNYSFHHDLYGLAEAPILKSIALSLWLRAGPSLRIVCGRFGTENLPDKHDEALAAMRARDANAVAQAIADDIRQGHEHIKRALS